MAALQEELDRHPPPPVRVALEEGDGRGWVASRMRDPGSLAAAMERLESRFETRLAALEDEVAELREEQEQRGARRISPRNAGDQLGFSERTVRRLVEKGDLEGAAVELPGRSRRKWVVLQSSVDRMLGRPAAPAVRIDRRASGALRRAVPEKP